MTDRTFSQQDQDRFARISGDWNPIHVDPIHARRTIGGAPVVHGVHLLLWALDTIVLTDEDAVPTRLSVSFDRFLIVGETATVRTVQRDQARISLKVEARGVARCSIDLGFASSKVEPPDFDPHAPTFAPDRQATERSAAEIDGLSGRIAAAAAAGEIATMFPNAARWLGPARIAALGATTRLVGMVCPGLYSIFAGMTLTFCDEGPSIQDGIGFSAGPARHGLVTMAIAGGGLRGTVKAVMRAPPRRQPAMRDLVSLVPSTAFAGGTAMVVGASRGLGELTAKLLAAGGADVIATWSEGEADALAVAEDIRRSGGQCRTMRYCVGQGTDSPALRESRPTHGYYFAAPTIASATSRFFDQARLDMFERFFVQGFWDFATLLRARRYDVRLFYPSTVYVEQRPRGLAEYAMAKAAGELLCAEINAELAPLTVVAARLPRLPTDQTAGIYESDFGDPVQVLLPLIREVQRVR